MTAHCTPVLDSPSSRWISGTAIDTIVWSMKVIATAKIIAARIKFLDRPPVALLTAMLPPRYCSPLSPASLPQSARQVQTAKGQDPGHRWPVRG